MNNKDKSWNDSHNLHSSKERGWKSQKWNWWKTMLRKTTSKLGPSPLRYFFTFTSSSHSCKATPSHD